MHWTDIEEIAEGLEETYSDEEIPERNLSYLKEMVLSLSNFSVKDEIIEKFVFFLVLTLRHG